MTTNARTMRCSGRHATILLLIVLVAAGCSRRPVANQTLTITYVNGQLFEKLTPDGVVTDSKGHVITRYDADAKTITFAADARALAGTVLHTQDSIHVRGPRVVDVKVGPFVQLRYRVTESNELRVLEVTDDGAGPSVPGAAESKVGHLEGYDASTKGAAWLGVMLCGLSVVVPPRAPLVLFDAKGKLVEQMSADGVIRDHLGTVLARYAAGSLPGDGTLKEPSSDRTLDLRVVVHDPRDVSVWPESLDFGYRIRVADTNEVLAQRLQRGGYPDATPVVGASEEPSGRLEGYVASQDGALRLGAMLYVLSSVEPHDPDARLPLERQPPPPPPPAPMSSRHR